MEAKELRMGNWINFIPHNSNFIVSQINAINSWEENINGLCLEDIEPIPLTEEWLLKFGFERVTPTENGYDNDCAYELKNFGRIALKNGVLIPDQYYFLAGLDFNLKHVHELQNLYFALTKKELTIKK